MNKLRVIDTSIKEHDLNSKLLTERLRNIIYCLQKQIRINIYVVVNFLFQVIFVFLLFLVMVIYANEVETKEKQKLPEIKN